MAKIQNIHTTNLKRALRDRFCQPEWSIFFEVASGTGATGRRRADAVAMNMYPSRGLEVHGFEIKASRADWLRELKNPQKAELVFQYCDRWWLVAGKGVVQEGELPSTWGLLELGTEKGSLRQAAPAPPLEPIPMAKPFIASLLRQAGKLDETERRDAMAAEHDRVREEYMQRVAKAKERANENYNILLKRIQEFEERTGIEIDRYGPSEELAKAIILVNKLGVEQTYGCFSSFRRSAESVVAAFEEAGINTSKS